MVRIDDSKVWFHFSQEIAPAAYAQSGDLVSFECRDCYDGQIDCDNKELSALDMERNNPVTGPLFVRGAKPGDVLKIEVQDVVPGDCGVMCVRTGGGLYAVKGCHCRRFPIRGGNVYFDRGVCIPIRPMIGVIGTCPAGAPVSTQSPGEHGGNLDIPALGAASTLYLPVFVPGALLSLGDLHAVQGEGETAICGMEVSGTVVLKVTVLKGAAPLPTPFGVSGDVCYTAAADRSLDVCSVQAAQKMHRWLMSRCDLTDVQAAMLLSLRGNLRISQVVNPLKGCVMEFPTALVRQLAAQGERGREECQI